MAHLPADAQVSERALTADVVAGRFTDPALDFEAAAEAVHRHQLERNPVYARFCEGERRFLPVAAFKHAPVTCFPPEEAERVFVSSGTGGGAPARHYVRRLAVYERSCGTHFEQLFGSGPFTLLGHLPGYAERGAASSLVHMVRHLIGRFGDGASGLFLEDRALLERAARHSERNGTPLLLFGAAFGLLDLVEQGPLRLPPSARVIETGGMKTRRREIGRAELHGRLAEGFGLPPESVWSEYGMCELLSQAYTRGGAVFYPPSWMRFRVVDPADPARELPEGRAGALAVTDLANVYSAAALLTEDLAVRRGDGFEVLGRLRGAELRGCNFLLE